MKISGSLKAPVFDGQISTTDTRLTLDETGVTLEKIAMTLKRQPDGDIALNLAKSRYPECSHQAEKITAIIGPGFSGPDHRRG